MHVTIIDFAKRKKDGTKNRHIKYGVIEYWCDYQFNVWWNWVTVTDSLTLALFQTVCWVKHFAVIPHSDKERVKTLCNIMQSAPSAILIIAQINEGRELDSAQHPM